VIVYVDYSTYQEKHVDSDEERIRKGYLEMGARFLEFCYKWGITADFFRYPGEEPEE
jgi:hypothetical protein